MDITLFETEEAVISGECVRIFYLQKILEQVSTIEIVNRGELPFYAEYSYSLDEMSWSPFVKSLDKFCGQINTVMFEGSEVYLRIKVHINKDSAIHSPMPKEYDDNTQVLGNTKDTRRFILTEIRVNGERAPVTNVEIPSIATVVETTTSRLFNPYCNSQTAIDLQKNLSRAIFDVVGMYVYYFRAAAEEAEKSVVFKQYTLKKVKEVKKLKILVPKNNIPTPRNTFTEWGIQFSDEMIIHVLEEYFVRAFGEGAEPRTHDYLYFPLTGRMYEVNTNTPIKSMMYTTIYHEVILVKYEDRNYVDDSEVEEFKHNFADYLVTNGNISVEESLERTHASPEYLDISAYESNRRLMHVGTAISEDELEIEGLTLFTRAYDMKGTPVNISGVDFSLKSQDVTNMCVACWLAFSNLNNRKLLSIISSAGAEMISLSLRDNKLRISSFANSFVASEHVIDKTKLYGVLINFSAATKFISLSIAQYDTATRALYLVDDQFDAITSLPTELFTADKLSIFGGFHKISYIRTIKQVVETNEVIPMLTSVRFDAEVYNLFDKCLPLEKPQFRV